MLYRYQKLNALGQIVNGRQDFGSIKEAEELLIGTGELLIFIEPDSSKKGSFCP